MEHFVCVSARAASTSCSISNSPCLHYVGSSQFDQNCSAGLSPGPHACTVMGTWCFVSLAPDASSSWSAHADEALFISFLVSARVNTQRDSPWESAVDSLNYHTMALRVARLLMQKKIYPSSHRRGPLFLCHFWLACRHPTIECLAMIGKCKLPRAQPATTKARTAR